MTEILMTVKISDKHKDFGSRRRTISDDPLYHNARDWIHHTQYGVEKNE